MAKVIFVPSQQTCDVAPQTKILLAGRPAGVQIRFGCAACRCGTCAVRIESGQDQLSPLKKDEEKMLLKLKLPSDGSIRLACQARVLGDCIIDLDFQDEYTPDVGFDEDS